MTRLCRVLDLLVVVQVSITLALVAHSLGVF